MQDTYLTARLSLSKLSLKDTAFITELVNTPEWIKFIGERNVHSTEEANAYVQKIMDSPNISYWVVKLRDSEEAIGIITFIKRDHLAHYDIGFAFLPHYTGYGYACEAAKAILADAIKEPGHTHILATTIKENHNSIRLLERLGLMFERETEDGNETLLLYSATREKLVSQLANPA